MGKADRDNDAKGHGGGRGGDTGAGSGQSARQGRGGQADVGGKSTPTGDSADTAGRDFGFDADYGFSEADTNKAGITRESINPHGNVDGTPQGDESGGYGLNSRDLDQAGITNVDHNARARARASLVHRDDSYAKSLVAKEKKGTLNPTEKDLVDGIHSGVNFGRAKNTIGGILSKGVSAFAGTIGSVPGVGSLAGKAVSAIGAESIKPDEAEHSYTKDGFALGEQATEHTFGENAAGMLGSLVSPPVGMAVSNMMEMHRNKDLAAHQSNPSASPTGKETGGKQSQSARAIASASMRSPSSPSAPKSASQYHSQFGLGAYNKSVPLASRRI